MFRVTRIDASGTMLGLTDQSIYVITDPAITTREISWNGAQNIDSQIIINAKSSGNIVVGPGTSNIFAGGISTYTLTPGQHLICYAFATGSASYTWIVYAKQI